MGNFFTADVIEPSGAVANDECPIKEFNKFIEGEACQSLNCNGLIDPLTKIINDPQLLEQMCEKDPLGFKDVYNRHFIKNENYFTKEIDPLKSMAMELVMRRWRGS